MQTTGRAVVYELVDTKGVADVEKTFDLAVYLKDNMYYEKLILDYDTFDPAGLNAQIIIQMPLVSADYTGEYSMDIETRFNNKVLTDKEFTEVTV